MYNLMLVDFGFHDDTLIHKINVITGDYLMPVRVKGDYYEQIDMIAHTIMKDRPDKIVFDKFGGGYGLYQGFIHRVSELPYSNCFKVDAFGLITHKEIHRD